MVWHFKLQFLVVWQLFYVFFFMFYVFYLFGIQSTEVFRSCVFVWAVVVVVLIDGAKTIHLTLKKHKKT